MRAAVRLYCALASLALAGAAVAAGPDRGSRIALRSVEIDVRRPAAVPAGLAAEAATALTPRAAESELVLVKYPAPVSASQRRALGEATERVLLYLPHDAFLVRVPRGTGAAFAPPGASWTGPYHPLYKISPEAAAVAADPGSLAAEERLPVLLHLDPDADLDAAVAALRALGTGRVVGARAKERLGRVRLLMTPAEIAAGIDTLARLGEVVWIELEGRRVLLNDTTAWVGQSGTAGGMATPVHDAGILGQGQVIAVLDTGLDADMCSTTRSRGCRCATSATAAPRSTPPTARCWRSTSCGSRSATAGSRTRSGTPTTTAATSPAPSPATTTATACATPATAWRRRRSW